ncbi:T9SS type A sorting domain-containing protein, partial [Erwinia amylovora]|uniref:T9SS type A sorting domain-containing protein n=1 Tax=Erwinia amylovora TaxID=552 RepID=UPI0020BFAFAF
TKQFTPYIFRFTAFTDSNSTVVAGWMIDNINLQPFGDNCPGGINEINSAHLKVYPDPAADVFQISMTDLHPSDYEVSICDLSGRVVMRQSF